MSSEWLAREVEIKDKQIVGLVKTNIPEIDDYELRFLPMFSTFIA